MIEYTLPSTPIARDPRALYHARWSTSAVAAIDQVFARDATCDYVSSGGIKAAREVMAWLARALAPWPANVHAVSNVTIEFDAERASARTRCYFVAPMGRGEMGKDQVVITSSGLYIDRVRKTAEGWRIVEREMRMLMQGALPEVTPSGLRHASRRNYGTPL
jgi:hypothetical protein